MSSKQQIPKSALVKFMLSLHCLQLLVVLLSQFLTGLLDSVSVILEDTIIPAGRLDLVLVTQNHHVGLGAPLLFLLYNGRLRPRPVLTFAARCAIGGPSHAEVRIRLSDFCCATWSR